MSKSLYLDTSSHLVVGLLDENFQWIEYYAEENYKNASKLHSLIFEILERNSLKTHNIQQFFRISGPGSYTGLRLSEGLSQFFDWNKINTYSFNHFLVPQLLGIEKGLWISKAFKNEIFVYSWEHAQNKKELIPEDQLMDLLQRQQPIFTHFKDSIPWELQETSLLIREQSQKLFTVIVREKIREATFYYRAVDDEFKPSLK